MNTGYDHKPVLLAESVEFLDVYPGGRYIDATVGGGGHTEAILAKGGKVLGIDQDPTSVEKTKIRLAACPEVYKPVDLLKKPAVSGGEFKIVQSNFTHLREIASKENFLDVDGVLFDLGFASFQVDDPSRGLSFLKDGPLDMRLDPNLQIRASDLINNLSEEELVRLFREYGEEQYARRIAKAIVKRRRSLPFLTTQDLAQTIERSRPVYKKKHKIHPATKVFLSLRIVINSEFDDLRDTLPQALEVLKPGGRLVVISFHSGEDRIVKNFMREYEERNLLKILTKNPLIPQEVERGENPRSRSAKLRAAVRL